MNGKEITNGLLQLGFNSGWAVTGNEITLWENEEPQPSTEEISNAAKLWETTQLAEAETKAATRQALLTRLGITEEEAKILLGGN
jgi:hypothetical protein